MYAGSNSEVHPLIASRNQYNAATDIDAMLSTVRTLREHDAESRATCEAMRARMEVYARKSEQVDAITSSLRAHGRPVNSVALEVEETLVELDERNEGMKQLFAWYDIREIRRGSLTERADEYERQALDTLRALATLVVRWPANMTRPVTPLDTEPKTAPVVTPAKKIA